MILSGGYGVLEGNAAIGIYDRAMKRRDWPRGALEALLAGRAASSGHHVLAFAGRTTDYATVLRRTPWALAAGRHAYLVTMEEGRRGAAPISTALGKALVAFLGGNAEFPTGTTVERLDL